jgi:hypothetical protein
MRVPTISQYYGPQTESIWRQFDPHVINCLTNDERVIQRALSSIPLEEWHDLEEALSQIPEKNPGMYRLWEKSWQKGKPLFLKTGLGKVAAFAIIGVVCLGLIVPILFGVARNALGNRPPLPPARPGPMQADLPRHAPVPPIPQAAQEAQRRAAQRAAEAANRRPNIATHPAGGGDVDLAKLQVGDRLEVHWGNKWWPANVVKVEANRAFVHYEGWSANSDEWVGPERMRSHVAVAK